MVTLRFDSAAGAYCVADQHITERMETVIVLDAHGGLVEYGTEIESNGRQAKFVGLIDNSGHKEVHVAWTDYDGGEFNYMPKVFGLNLYDEDYPLVRLWHKMTGSMLEYTNAMVEQAKLENAPQNATFRHNDGTWATMATCQNPKMFVRLGLEVPERLRFTGTLHLSFKESDKDERNSKVLRIMQLANEIGGIEVSWVAEDN